MEAQEWHHLITYRMRSDSLPGPCTVRTSLKGARHRLRYLLSLGECTQNQMDEIRALTKALKGAKQ